MAEIGKLHIIDLQIAKTRPTRRAGFTMVELMVALGVLAIALAGVASAIITGMSYSEINREQNLARDAAMSFIDEVRAQPVNQALSAFLIANANAAVPGLPAGQRVTTFTPAAPWPADGGIPYLVEVRVQITWRSTRGIRTFQITTLITR